MIIILNIKHLLKNGYIEIINKIEIIFINNF